MKLIKLFTSTLLLLVMNVTASTALASSFGYPGQNGNSGLDGYNGRNGPGMSITADGGNYRYDLRGDDGYPGQDGADGRSASSCQQPRDVPYNLNGAEGGSGGKAGDGGNGGSGGDFVVYYSDITNVRNIYVDSLGGRGGESGRPGRGSYGCNCTTYSWQVNGATYICNDGIDGYNGSYGRNGILGATGTAKLISQLNPLPQERPNRLIKLSVLSAADQDISRHMWTTRDGAASLFAAGSRVASRYSLYLGTQVVTYTLDWRANRPAEDFNETGIQIYFGQNGPSVAVSDDVWMSHKLEGVGPSVSLQVTNAIKVAEVQDLKIEKFTGTGRDLSMVLIDNSPVDALETSFGVTYYTPGLALWRVRYDGGVASSLITKADGKILVNIGRLNIHSDFLQKGTSFLIQVRAKRSFESRYLTLSYEKQSKIQ